jgi:hypothetical protein
MMLVFRVTFGKHSFILSTQLSKRLTIFLKQADMRILGSTIHLLCDIHQLWSFSHPGSGGLDKIISTRGLMFFLHRKHCISVFKYSEHILHSRLQEAV